MITDIPSIRLHNQHLSAPRYTNPGDVVRWFGAMQAQDFAAAKWALALRCINQTDASIEQAFNEGKILRTHIMRPTWHFVHPEDIRWILALTSPQVHKFNGYYYRKSGLDKDIFQKTNEIIRTLLKDGKQLTRDEINAELIRHKIPTDRLGLSYTLMQAELDGIICSGPRKGKQFTYMLLDERVPPTKEISRDEALVELITRFFQSHGPAQVQDFVWWSGLSIADMKHGVELMGSTIQHEVINEKIYWWIGSPTVKKSVETSFLVPAFDEYFVAYKDRRDILDADHEKEMNVSGAMISGAVLINGKIKGKWSRKFEKKTVVIKINLFEKITKSQEKSIAEQAEKYGRFINLPVSQR